MEQSVTTKLNDAVTERQINRYLANAKLPQRWQGKVKVLEDVLQMPIIFQDQLFSAWISQYLKNFPEGKSYPNNQYLLKQMSLQRLYRNIQYTTWNAQQMEVAAKGDVNDSSQSAPRVTFTNNPVWTQFNTAVDKMMKLATNKGVNEPMKHHWDQSRATGQDDF